jgi:hypothetical protein
MPAPNYEGTRLWREHLERRAAMRGTIVKPNETMSHHGARGARMTHEIKHGKKGFKPEFVRDIPMPPRSTTLPAWQVRDAELMQLRDAWRGGQTLSEYLHGR